MSSLYRFQVLDKEHKSYEDESVVLCDFEIEPPEGYELVDWKVNRHGSIVVCWRLNVNEQVQR